MKKLIDKLVWLGEKIDIGCKAFLGVQLVAITIVILTQIALRFAGHSISWATEFATLSFVWASMLGSAIASRYMLHIGVDTIRDRLRGKAKEIFMIASHTVLFIGLVIFTFSSFEYTVGQVNHVATTMPAISLSWFYCSLPICGLIMMYYTFVQMLEILTYGDAVKLTNGEEEL